MNSIDNIINVLGYNNSEFLYYWDDFKEKNLTSSTFSFQVLRTLNELNPYAFYCIENKPFVLFFQTPTNPNMLKAIHKKIWNSQIAIAIFDYEGYIEIYNGYTLKPDEEFLSPVGNIHYNNVNNFSDFSYWNITSSNFWRKFDTKFSQPKIDALMLENVKYITNNLKDTVCKPFAVQLILRLIFTRFLIDRGVDLDFEGFTNEAEQSRRHLLNIMKSKNELYKLFRHLQVKFNGNLFDLYYDDNSELSEFELLNEQYLEMLHDFLSGALEMESGQYSLFHLYDFNIIPVELISNIYERFLGEEKQKQDSAFYTPPYLVDYILQQTVKPHLKKNISCSVFDPACGSGIFLVETLRSIIENNLNGSSYFNDNEELKSLLTNNIYGVDKNKEAIDVAIFSLYLTLLDYKDPKTLKDFKLPKLKNCNFFVDDFFISNMQGVLKNKKFNFIIGNPPWGKVDNSPHIEYCKNNGIPLQNNEIARSFIARTKDFANIDTQCCLVVTSKLFYNSKLPAKKFREWLLTNTKLEKFIELAAVRELIFKKARGPAAIILYKFDEDSNESNEICHLTLKPNMFFKLFNIIVIEKNDIKFIPQSLLLKDDWAWKTIVFGTTHDYYNIKRLKNRYNTIRDIIKHNGIKDGRGIETADGKMDSEHLCGKRLIDSTKGISAFKISLMHMTTFNKKRIHRIRNGSLFKPPYTLIKKGFDTKSYRLRAVYSEEKFLYRDAITGLVGSENNKEILLSLTGIINSSFYAYLNLMLGTSAGIEREQALPTEIFKFPAMYNSEIASKVERIQRILCKKEEDFSIIDDDVDKLLEDLDKYVLSCFSMEDDIFVDYALNVQIPLLTGDKKIFREVNEIELIEYAQTFIDYWDEMLNDNNQFVQVTLYPSIMKRFSSIEVKILDENPKEKIKTCYERNTNIDFISKFMLNRYNDLFYQIKEIVNFEERSFLIIKTNEYKNWHPAISQLDLAEVIDSVLLEEGDK